MTKDIGVSAEAAGLSSGDGAASVSTLRASIPDAWLEPGSFQPRMAGGKPRHLPSELRTELEEMVEKLRAHVSWLSEERKIRLLTACMNVSQINCSWQQYGIAEIMVFQIQHELAQAIEAGTAETERLSPKGESVVRQDAPNTPQGGSHEAI